MYRVRTSINDKSQAKIIAKELVINHAAASVHIREINSIYTWNNKIEDITEYEVEVLCSNVEICITLIKNYHTYQCPEILYEQIDCSKDLGQWCDQWCFCNK